MLKIISFLLFAVFNFSFADVAFKKFKFSKDFVSFVYNKKLYLSSKSGFFVEKDDSLVPFLKRKNEFKTYFGVNSNKLVFANSYLFLVSYSFEGKAKENTYPLSSVPFFDFISFKDGFIFLNNDGSIYSFDCDLNLFWVNRSNLNDNPFFESKLFLNENNLYFVEKNKVVVIDARTGEDMFDIEKPFGAWNIFFDDNNVYLETDFDTYILEGNSFKKLDTKSYFTNSVCYKLEKNKLYNIDEEVDKVVSFNSYIFAYNKNSLFIIKGNKIEKIKKDFDIKKITFSNGVLIIFDGKYIRKTEL